MLRTGTDGRIHVNACNPSALKAVELFERKQNWPTLRHLQAGPPKTRIENTSGLIQKGYRRAGFKTLVEGRVRQMSSNLQNRNVHQSSAGSCFRYVEMSFSRAPGPLNVL